MKTNLVDAISGCKNCGLGDDGFCSDSCKVAYKDAIEYGDIVDCSPDDAGLNFGKTVYIPRLVDIGKTGSPKSPTHIGWGNGTALCGAIIAESEAMTVDTSSIFDRDQLYPVSLRESLCSIDLKLLGERVRQMKAET